LVKAAWGTIGFRTPPKDNTIAAFALYTPDVKVTVNMLLSMEATPAAPGAGDVKETVVPAPQLGDPDRVTTSLEFEYKVITGVKATVQTTPDLPAIKLDSVNAGELTPINPLMMLGNVVTTVVPRRTFKLSIKTAEFW
jgi:hypothetical protein